MAKALLDFKQIKDHAKVNMPVKIGSALGKVSKVSETGIDVTVEAEFSTVTNHYDETATELFEVDLNNTSFIKDKAKLDKRIKASKMNKDEIFESLMSEIEDLKSRIATLEAR